MHNIILISQEIKHEYFSHQVIHQSIGHYFNENWKNFPPKIMYNILSISQEIKHEYFSHQVKNQSIGHDFKENWKTFPPRRKLVDLHLMLQEIIHHICRGFYDVQDHCSHLER